MTNMWLGIFGPDVVQMTKHGGKPRKAFNVLAIVVARDHMAIERENLLFELGDETASAMVNPEKPKLKDIIDLLEQAGEGFYILAWGNKKPNKKRGTDRSFLPVFRNNNGWQACSRRPPYHLLSEFASDELMAEAIMRLIRRAG